jgi:hypothetical protein
MTKLLEQAVEAARALPPDMQDELARMLLQFAGEDQPVIQLTAEEASSLEASLAQAARGEFVTKPKRKKLTQKEQSARFRQTSRELGCDESEDALERAFRKIVPAKRSQQS